VDIDTTKRLAAVDTSSWILTPLDVDCSADAGPSGRWSLLMTLFVVNIVVDYHDSNE